MVGEDHCAGPCVDGCLPHCKRKKNALYPYRFNFRRMRYYIITRIKNIRQHPIPESKKMGAYSRAGTRSRCGQRLLYKQRLLLSRTSAQWTSFHTASQTRLCAITDGGIALSNIRCHRLLSQPCSHGLAAYLTGIHFVVANLMTWRKQRPRVLMQDRGNLRWRSSAQIAMDTSLSTACKEPPCIYIHIHESYNA